VMMAGEGRLATVIGFVMTPVSSTRCRTAAARSTRPRRA
jgi:hypothetical protein